MVDPQRGGGSAAPATLPPLAAGFVVRPYRGESDHPGMAAALTAVRAAEGNPDAATAEGMTAHYRYLEGDLSRDCVVIERHGSIVGYARLSQDTFPDGRRTASLFTVLTPDARDAGVEPHLVRRQTDRAMEILRGHAPTQPTGLGAVGQAAHPALTDALVAAGFRLIREYAHLVRPDLLAIPDVPLPEGYELRPVPRGDMDIARRIYLADKRAFADSWGETAASEQEFMDRWESPANQPELQQVAWYGDEIAGMVMAYLAEPGPDGTITGMTEGISVQPEHRRKGLARAMLVAALRAVRDAGAVRASLSVDLLNPNQAADLYRELGFRDTGAELEFDGGSWAPGEIPAPPIGETVR